jgi:hypothetical protein
VGMAHCYNATAYKAKSIYFVGDKIKPNLNGHVTE